MDTKCLPTRFYRKEAEKFNKKVERANRQASHVVALSTASPGFLEKDEGERVSQEDILKEVDIGSSSKRFDLTLRNGPFAIDYSRNGRFLAYCGKQGVIGAFDWLTKRPLFESSVGNECRDIKFLHQETFIAVAERSYTCIYDNQGLEIHCIKKLNGILRLEFLPYHFLMVASAENGFLYYLDSSIGSIVSSIPTYMGRLAVMCQNMHNAVICTGHSNGAVSMWVPSEKTYVVKIFAHHSGIASIACDRSGNYLATSGLDRKLKIWDIRSTYNPLSEISLPITATCLDYSQRGLLAIGAGNTVQILRDAHLGSSHNSTEWTKQETVASGVNRRVLASAYLSHFAVRPVHRTCFCPYEDILGIATSSGISSILCPGSAEPNYDALEENPFANRRYRQEREVKRLLDKIPYTMISLQSVVGQVRREDVVEEWEKKKALLLGQVPKTTTPEVKRNKQKGRSKPGRLEAKKQNIRLERKLFGIKDVLGVREVMLTKKRKTQNHKRKKVKLSKPSDLLIPKKQLAKKRLKSALDVLIPTKE